MNTEAMEHYEAALKEAFPRGATGDVFHHWNEARKAIEQAEKQERKSREDDEALLRVCLKAMNRSDYLGWQLNIPIIKDLRKRLGETS